MKVLPVKPVGLGIVHLSRDAESHSLLFLYGITENCKYADSALHEIASTGACFKRVDCALLRLYGLYICVNTDLVTAAVCGSACQLAKVFFCTFCFGMIGFRNYS